MSSVADKKLLSLCMIVKNEELYLPRCLKSIAGVVDEIIVVDTGSTDRTVEIAVSMGAKVKNIEWKNNFSEARNTSLEMAAGEWIIFLDADEELAAESRQALRELIENTGWKAPGVEGYFVKIINYIGSEGRVETCPDLVFRIFRNRPHYRFQGAVHEQIASVILGKNPQAKYQSAEEIIIKHYGYLDEQVAGKDKIQRNLAIIEKELKEHPENFLLRYHYGVELFRARRYQEAAEEFTCAANHISPQAFLFPKLIRYLVVAHYSARQFEQALAAAEIGLKLFPQYPDLYYYSGLVHMEEKNYSRAYHAFLKAVSLPPPPTHYASFEGVRGFRACYYLGQICEAFLEEEEAMNFYLQSLRDHPGFILALEKIIRLLQPRENPVYALSCLKKILEIDAPGACRLLGEIFFRQGAYSLAREFLEKSTRERPLPPEAQLWKAICLIQEKHWLEGIRILQQFAPPHPLYPLAKLNEAFCFWVQGNRRKTLAALAELKSLELSPETQKVISLLERPKKNLNSLKPSKTPRITLEANSWPLFLEFVQRLLEMEEKEKAKLLIRQIDFSPTPEYLLPIGELLHKFGEEETALTCLKEHLRYFSSAEAHFLAAEISRRCQDLWSANYHYRCAIALNPDEPHYYLSQIKFYEEASRYWGDEEYGKPHHLTGNDR